MNNQRRDAINKLIGQIDDLKSQLETLKDEEEEAYDNMPDGLKNSGKGDAAQEAIDALNAEPGDVSGDGVKE